MDYIAAAGEKPKCPKCPKLLTVDFTGNRAPASALAPVRGFKKSSILSRFDTSQFQVRALYHQLDSLPGGLFGSAGVPTRPAGYTEDSSRAESGIPPAASRQLHSLTHTPSWVYRRRLTGRVWNTASSTHSHPLPGPEVALNWPFPYPI
jgi:hypothetical protein